MVKIQLSTATLIFCFEGCFLMVFPRIVCYFVLSIHIVSWLKSMSRARKKLPSLKENLQFLMSSSLAAKFNLSPFELFHEEVKKLLVEIEEVFEILIVGFFRKCVVGSNVGHDCSHGSLKHVYCHLMFKIRIFFDKRNRSIFQKPL